MECVELNLFCVCVLEVWVELYIRVDIVESPFHVFAVKVSKEGGAWLSLGS